LMALVEQARLPKTVGLSAAMHGAAKGEHIARGQACFNIREWPVRNPKRVVAVLRVLARW